MRKRLSAAAIEKIEAQVIAASSGKGPAVFGVCGADRRVLRKWVLGPDKIPIPSDAGAEILIPERLEKLLWPKRYKIVWGGRGSAKTRTVISILTERMRSFRERLACFREIQDSIADSSYQEFVDEIERRGEDGEFRCTDNRLRVPNTKSSASFAGLYRNITKVKGKAGATIAWVEEAENVSRESYDVLKPTIRAAGSEIWITFNPRNEKDPSWADLVAPYWDRAVDGIYEDDDVLIIQCNHIHNPWLTDELKMERDALAALDPDRYNWIWEGKFKRRSNDQVYSGKWAIREFEPGEDWSGPYFGADFGFADDPSTLVKTWIHDSRLYVEYEAYGQHVELDDMPRFYDTVPGSRKYKIWGDNSRPETISHIKKHGFKIVGCDKWPGSVEDGITHIRSYEEIVIHPRCRHTIDEMSEYKYKTDRLTGEVLPDIIDKNNHIQDAIRYSLNNIIKAKGRDIFDILGG